MTMFVTIIGISTTIMIWYMVYHFVFAPIGRFFKRERQTQRIEKENKELREFKEKAVDQMKEDLEIVLKRKMESPENSHLKRLQ